MSNFVFWKCEEVDSIVKGFFYSNILLFVQILYRSGMLIYVWFYGLGGVTLEYFPFISFVSCPLAIFVHFPGLLKKDSSFFVYLFFFCIVSFFLFISFLLFPMKKNKPHLLKVQRCSSEIRHRYVDNLLDNCLTCLPLGWPI